MFIFPVSVLVFMYSATLSILRFGWFAAQWLRIAVIKDHTAFSEGLKLIS